LNILNSLNNNKCLLPEILAPAGNRASFLAALAAGADAVYCGMKHFSARRMAKNFSLEEFASLTRLAHDMGIKVYVAFNSLLKPDDLNRAARLAEALGRWVKPDALIISDLSFVQLVRQTGFSGELHLSTLANASFPAALNLIRGKLGIDRVVVPRELSIDEVKTLAGACPDGLGLEVFIHGAKQELRIWCSLLCRFRKVLLEQLFWRQKWPKGQMRSALPQVLHSKWSEKKIFFMSGSLP